jgi:hypothetical protein
MDRSGSSRLGSGRVGTRSNVRFGSEADIGTCPRDVRFTAESRTLANLISLNA